MERIDLPHDQALTIEDGGRLLRLRAADGSTPMRIRITPEGPVLEVDGALAVRAGGALDLEGESVRIHSRSRLLLSADGDAAFRVRGDLLNRARTHDLRSELGDVKIAANDDVRINGERVLVNM